MGQRAQIWSVDREGVQQLLQEQVCSVYCEATSAESRRGELCVVGGLVRADGYELVGRWAELRHGFLSTLMGRDLNVYLK